MPAYSFGMFPCPRATVTTGLVNRKAEREKSILGTEIIPGAYIV